MDIEQARADILSRDRLVWDVGERELRRRVERGELLRLGPGRFVTTKRWEGLYAEDRHLLEVVACDQRRQGGEAVVSHVSAAVLHGLPLYRTRPTRVHISGGGTDGRTNSGGLVAHHGVAVPDEDVVTIGGIRCTGLTRTAYDVARQVSRNAAVACLDAAMRSVAWDERSRTYDPERAEQWRDAVMTRLTTGARGIRQARWVFAFADGRAQLPGESVSRVLLDELGFRHIRLQVPFVGPAGQDWAVDFGLDDVAALGEFDGEGKYVEAALRAGRTIEQVVRREKEREDWIRGISQRRFVRWTSAQLASAAALRDRLARHGVHPPR
ncbi:hypothetical protein [Microbacterium xanthum]|uniref:hypothetical protein n=1 Tax=Microbacterium xanthum TaxID=3079794 RepID=UPI002AD2B9D1|nr:hypothetical protein [Microbacterium sp. KSW-48]MDZ8170618.1 hypothetical protein [Microbacterium sp. KSW-48]